MENDMNDSSLDIVADDETEIDPENPCQSSDWFVFVINCTLRIDINSRAPLDVALPLYGYLLPVVIIVTILTNSVVVIILSHLPSPTNSVLLAMAVTEALTGVCSVPWLLYYYTFQGYKYDEVYGLPEFWCKNYPLFTQTLPTIFHTGAIWLTVFLALQRFLNVCVPTFASSFNTLGRTRAIIAAIIVLPILIEIPKSLSTYNNVRPMEDPNSPNERRITKQFCLLNFADWVRDFGVNEFYSAYYWITSLFVHVVPCLLLVVLGGFLIMAIHKAELRRQKTLMPTKNRSAKMKNGSPSVSTSSKSFHATTKMLVVLIFIFLCMEIPSAIIFITHFFLSTSNIPQSAAIYEVMNRALIIRNVLMLLSYPFNFAIYCGMSLQFRLTAAQLFSRKGLSPRTLSSAANKYMSMGGRSVLLDNATAIDAGELQPLRRTSQLILPPEPNELTLINENVML